MQDLRNLIKPGVWIIAIAFIVSIAFMYGRSAFQGERQESLVEVNGVAISYQDFLQVYQDIYTRYQEQLEEEISPQLEQYLRSQVLSEMVKNELLWQETKKAKIKVSQEEVNETVLEIMKPFGSQEAFMRFLDYRHILYSEVEEDIEKQLAINKLTQAIGNSAAVTEEELKNHWIIENENIGVSYVVVKPEKYKDEIEPIKKELEEYYEEYKENFRVPEKVKVDYILIKPEDFADKVSEASKEELESYYQEHLSYFSFAEERRASHILIQIADTTNPEDDEKAKEKIEKIEEELKGGADFATLAKKYSEDSASAEKGGDLEFFTYYEMVPSFSEAVFSLEKAEDVSEIIKTPFGYHLIKLTGIKASYIKPFQEVEERLEQMWKDEKSETLAQEEASNIRKEIEKKSSAFEEYIKEYPQRSRTTSFFAQEGEIEGLGWLAQFNQVAFSLKPEEISSILEIPEGYCLLKLKEREPSFIPPLEDATEKTEEKLIEKKSKKIAEDIANQIAIEAKQESLSILGTKLDLEYKNLESLKRTDWVEGMSSEDKKQFIDTAFSLKEGETSKPLNLLFGYYIIELNTRELLLDTFSEQKEEFKENLLSQKRAKNLDLWLQQIWEKAKIVDNSSLFFSP
jgi:peptidyl-prolyl cis-trans isomerase D